MKSTEQLIDFQSGWISPELVQLFRIKLKTPCLWRANKYKGWNGEWHQGKIHVIDEKDSGRLMCGKRITDVPGSFTTPALSTEPNCKGCLKGIETRKKQAEYEKEYESRQQAQEEEKKQWWQWYNGYLESPKWKERRKLVIQRSRGMCEGCGKSKPTQVHHLTYERVGEELLFDLAAVCDNCHKSAHRLPSFFWDSRNGSFHVK